MSEQTTTTKSPSAAPSAVAAPRGRFVWYDLMTNDPQRAVEFYTQLIGWGTQLWEGAQPYTMWTNGGTPLGGVMPMPPDAAAAGAPPHWMAYVAVPDVKATADDVARRGGTILVPPTDIPTVGAFTVFADPQGAMISAFTPLEQAMGHDGPPAVGEFSWHELTTTDHRKAFEFYQAIFGWDAMSEFDMGAMGIYQIFGRHGQQLGGMFDKSAEMTMPPYWLQYIHVDDADAAAKRVPELGGQIIMGPMEVPGGDRIAICVDPTGAAFAVHATKK